MKILLIIIVMLLFGGFVVYIAHVINKYRASFSDVVLIIYWIAILAFTIGVFTNSFTMNDNEIIHNYLKGNYKMEITIDSETNKADTVYILK